MPAYSAPDAGPVAKKHSVERSQHLPVLRNRSRVGGVDARPRGSALARRDVHVGKSGRLLPSLQSQKGQSLAHRSANETAARTALLQLTYQPAYHAVDGPL